MRDSCRLRSAPWRGEMSQSLTRSCRDERSARPSWSWITARVSTSSSGNRRYATVERTCCGSPETSAQSAGPGEPTEHQVPRREVYTTKPARGYGSGDAGHSFGCTGGTMTVQARRIARERDRANQEAQRANREAATAKQVSDFLVGLFNVSDPSEARGNTLTAREILDSGAKQIDDTLNGQPAVQARLPAHPRQGYTSLGLYPRADELMERALTTNQHLFGPLESRKHRDTVRSR